MKKFLTLIAALFFAATVWAQSDCPQRLSYQAVVRNAANELVTNRSGIDVFIKITDGDNTYSETHTLTSNQNGLISFMIGEDYTDQTGSMDEMDWANAKMITVVTVPGESAVKDTTEMVAVPYALYACDINPNGVNITKIVTDINNHIIDTLDNYYTKDETDKKFLTIDGLCDSIKNNCEDVALRNAENTFTDKNTFTDTVIVEKGAVKEDGSIDTKDSLRAVNAADLVNYTNNFLTIDGLCDSIKNNCEDVALRNAENTFTEKNTFIDTVIVENGAVKEDGSIDTKDSLRAVNAKDLANYVANTVVDTIKYEKFSATASQTEFTLNVATGSTIITDSRFVQFFINGVFVGTSVDGVVTVDDNKVTYVPVNNDGYVLVAGDRIQVIYWVKKNN